MIQTVRSVIATFAHALSRFTLVGFIIAAITVPIAGHTATPRTPDATSLLNWAERTFPTYFEGPQSNRTIDIWTYRYYPKTDSYLGVNTSSDFLWLKGKGGGYETIQLGKTADFSCKVYPQDCVAEPRASGDIVGRELDIKGLGSAGHIGVYDGANVIEVLNEGGNVVKINSYDNFKNRSLPWTPVYTKFSAYHMIKSCWGSSCDLATSSSNRVGLYAQYAVPKRAYQIYLIGADYTLSASAKEAEPKYFDGTDKSWSGRPAIRGLYRCDTFVIHAFFATTMLDRGANNGRTITGAPYGWSSNVSNLVRGLILPTTVFDKLRNL